MPGAAVCVLGPEQFVRTHSEYSMVDVIIIVALLADPRCYLEIQSKCCFMAGVTCYSVKRMLLGYTSIGSELFKMV